MEPLLQPRDANVYEMRNLQSTHASTSTFSLIELGVIAPAFDGSYELTLLTRPCSRSLNARYVNYSWSIQDIDTQVATHEDVRDN